METCPRCGEQVAQLAKFCPECGTPLAAPSPAREERKVVTVVFCDLVGSTAQAERLDPEDVRAILSTTTSRCARTSSASAGRSRSSSATR
ncbi:MAG: zinc ribbon domain-containing protein [Actinobacteria bacterium]|nr:zinc ribbon domain-containing protein [Actinomycetota bacterium]